MSWLSVAAVPVGWLLEDEITSSLNLNYSTAHEPTTPRFPGPESFSTLYLSEMDLELRMSFS